LSPASVGGSAWTEGGPEEVSDGVFRIPLPLPGDGLKAVNAYLLRSQEGDLLIDCGWDDPHSWELLVATLGRLGSGLGSVRLVFATHVHGDHLGAAGRIRDGGRAFVTLGLGDRETAVLLATDPDLARSRTRALLRRYGADSVAEAMDEAEARQAQRVWLAPLPDLFISGGAVRMAGRELEVIPTPGHTRGHLCLWDRSGAILFAGDHVLPHITPSIGVEVPDDGLPLLNFLRSLERVRELPAKLVLPAHGPAFQDLGGRIDELLEHHRQRLLLCREAVAAGASTAIDVARALPWTRRGRRFEDLDAFNQMLAVGESAAHLELLVERGELGQVMSNSVVTFTPTQAETDR
jgi:glyoxylase-like metal-dependent hydrolase (beta-lactamase superfamily II)